MFGPLAKWVAQIDRAERIPEFVARAYATACCRAARPGRARAARGHARARRATPPTHVPFRAHRPQPGAGRHRARCADCSRAPSGRSRSSAARAGRPQRRRGHARRSWRRTRCPAGAAFRRQDSLDNDSPSYVGDVGIGINPALAARVREADLLLVVGPRLGEMTTVRLHAARRRRRRGRRSCTSIRAPRSSAASIRPTCRSLRGMAEFAAAVRGPAGRAALAASGRRRRAPTTRRGSSTARCRASLDLGECIAHLRERVPERDRHATAPATSPVWVHRFWRWHGYPSQLAPTSGAMGYGVPAAVAAKVVHPERDRRLLRRRRRLPDERPGARDRGAVRRCRSSSLVVDNGMYGTIRMHQERRFPGPRRRHRPRQPRLRRLRAGVRRATARTSSAPRTSRRRSSARSASARPAVLALRLDPEAITPRTTLSALGSGG